MKSAASAGEPPETVPEGVGWTPLLRLVVPVRGQNRRLWLKLEGANEYGSIKARTAHALLGARERSGELRPGGAIVESTSGNLGVALAGMCRQRGYRCTLVVDADTPERSMGLMEANGAEVIVVERVPGRNPVAERLATVRRLLQERPGAVWTDQYSSPANPDVHYDWTAPELVSGLGNTPPDAVVAAVSTGGTLAGLSRYFREHHPDTRMVAVDAAGSVATGGRLEPRPFKIPGFGSGRPSAFLGPAQWDVHVLLDDLAAARACRLLRAATELALGGSAGAAVLGAVIAALGDDGLRDICVICPDMGGAYLGTVYADPPAGPTETGPLQREGLEAIAAADVK
ncbi:cysteine synthase family protein [Streptomyces sp. NPDC059918]|uniref:cysteine synthase family protein n=1 Tax=unclassified Streptomyces TaxID=2593676 RepID=UPI0036605796